MARRNKNKRAAIVRTKGRAQNVLASPSGANGSGDRGAGWNPVRRDSPMMKERQLTELYYSDWAAKKIVNIPVEDMLREPFKFTGLEQDLIDEIESEIDRLKLMSKLSMALKLERLLGGCCILMGVGQGDDPEQPLDLDTLDYGCLKWLHVIPRSRIARTIYTLDPFSAGYGEPEKYIIQGKTVHRSRMIIFDGEPLTPNGGSELLAYTMRRNDGFGQSVLEALEEDIHRATGTRQGAFNLVNVASVMTITTDLMSLKASSSGNDRLDELEQISQQVSMYRAAILDGGQDGKSTVLSNIAASFGSVPELLMSFLQVLSAASDIPATRFIGQAPGGLNATGDSDLENYYNSIASKQHQRLRPNLMQILAVMGKSLFGNEFDITGVDVEFEPLWNLSELEESTVRTNDGNMLVGLAGAGIISTTEANEEARKRKLLIVDEDDLDLDDMMGTEFDAPIQSAPISGASDGAGTEAGQGIGYAANPPGQQ